MTPDDKGSDDSEMLNHDGSDDEHSDDDNILSWGEHDGDDDSSGLEIDEGQAQEMKNIFLTTLPQYLQPVEQMMEQLFAESGDAASETRQALSTTLASLGAAAARIGFEEIARLLDGMAEAVTDTEEASEQELSELRDQLFADLGRIREISTGSQEAPVLEGDDSQTLFAALHGLDGIDDSVSGRLTSAGLVTVDQLLKADVEDVVAVSGLTPEVVHKLVAALVRAGDSSDQADIADAGDAAPNPGDAQVVELRVDPSALRAQLEQKLRTQVELEAAVDELRAQINRLRAQADQRREELYRLEQEHNRAPEPRQSADSGLADPAEELQSLHEVRAELAERCTATEKAMRREEQRILDLRRQRRAILSDQTRFGRDVAGILEDVERMLRTAFRG